MVGAVGAFIKNTARGPRRDSDDDVLPALSPARILGSGMSSTSVDIGSLVPDRLPQNEFNSESSEATRRLGGASETHLAKIDPAG